MSSKNIYGLTQEKYNLIKKYSLTLNDDLIWEFHHDKYHTIKYFTNKFAIKHSTLALLFNIHRLCYAKIKYFEKIFDKFNPYKYDYKVGFHECELFDMEFILHKPSNIIIDLRNLQSIKDIDEFKRFCNYLETFEGSH